MHLILKYSDLGLKLRILDFCLVDLVGQFCQIGYLLGVGLLEGQVLGQELLEVSVGPLGLLFALCLQPELLELCSFFAGCRQRLESACCLDGDVDFLAGVGVAGRVALPAGIELLDFVTIICGWGAPPDPHQAPRTRVALLSAYSDAGVGLSEVADRVVIFGHALFRV